jgi:thiol:disulfide interchange protein DsbC
MHSLNTMKDLMFRILLLAALTFSCAAYADDLSRLKTKLQQDYPQIGQVQQVNKTPVPGLYEVVTTEHLFYVDQTGQYLIDGSLYDLHSMRNLTDEHLYNFSSLPLDLALKQVKGNGKRKMFIFTDPNCGFCKRLEAELQKVDNVTIYRLLYPIFPGSKEKARNIWCGKDRNNTLDAWMLHGVEPAVANCNAPTMQALQWGQKLRVSGTPALIFADGTFVPGYLPAAQLEQALNAPPQQSKK